MEDPLADLRLADVTTFLAVHRARSITGAARLIGVTPSQVSKAVARLERLLNVSLLVRGPRGISISESGARFVPRLEEIVERLQALRSEERPSPEITIAAPSYLHAFFVPFVAAGLPEHRLRCLSLPPALVRAYASERLFDVALSVGAAEFPETWGVDEIGPMRRGLFASPKVAARFGSAPIEESELAAFSFISPVYVVNGQAVPVDEGCPLPRGKRRLGQEVETIGLGLELAARSDQLVFGPILAAHQHLREGTLVQLKVVGWPERTEEPIYVHCSGGMRMRERRTLVESCRAALAAIAV